MSSQSACDAIIAASKVNREPGQLFCLGPNSGRISFQSQQVRALNLVWALQKRGYFSEGAKVAVVGAGISGVTAAFALRAYDARVVLFDRAGRALHRQLQTTHRHVHPTINWWPTEPGLSPTTSLPFLDWHLGQCDLVVKVLDQQLTKLKEQSKSYLDFQFRTHVEDAIFPRVAKGRIILKTDRGDFPNFDLVIVASGFGEERELGSPFPNSCSYWNGDNLESCRDGPNPPKRFIVSGAGDGGLIDALRIAYDFDFGRLSFRIAEAAAPVIVKRIGEIESNQSAELARWRIASMGYESLAEEVANKSKKRPYGELRRLLDAKLRDQAHLVLLVDNTKQSPYESSAAPVHKLMIAYAAVKGVVRFLHGRLEKIGETGRINAGSEEINERDVRIIVRHGAQSFNDKLIRSDEWMRLEAAQKNSAEYSFRPAWADDPPPVPQGWHCPKRDAEKYVSAMKELAEDTLREIGSRGVIATEGDRFLVYGHDIDYRPTELFGKAVSYREQPGIAHGL